MTEFTLPLGITWASHDNDLSQKVRDVFGDRENTCFSVRRLSEACFEIEIKHKKVLSARYDYFDYKDTVAGLIGDVIVLGYQRKLRLKSFDQSTCRLTIEVEK